MVKKNVVSIIFLLLIINFSFAFCGGGGIEGDPFRICNLNDLNDVRNDLSAHYVLANDINASDTINWFDGGGWIPIGDESSPSTTAFRGVFDGNNFSINNLYINRPTQQYLGLFGHIFSDSVIKNLDLNATIVSNGYSGCLTGGQNIHDSFSSLIENVNVDCNIIGNHARTGGIIGWQIDGNIHKSSFVGTVSGHDYTGGIIGQQGNNVGSSILGVAKEVSSRGNIYSSTSHAGGIIGFQRGILENAYSLANVTATQGSVGGITGNLNLSGSYILNSYAIGLVTGNSWASSRGGIAGTANGDVNYSYYNNETTTRDKACGTGSGDCLTSPEDGNTTLELTQQPTFENWDFNDVWTIHPNINEGYPFFSWEQNNFYLNKVYNLTQNKYYLTIQESINEANNYDHIFITNNTYVENVIINKPIIIEGESVLGVIVDGGGTSNAITIDSSDVKIFNLTVTNSGSLSDNAGLRVNLGHSNIIISDINAISNNSSGIHITSGNSIIQNCYSSDNVWGIRIDFDSNFTIRNCLIENNLRIDPINDVYGQGIRAISVTDSFIYDNNILSSAREGILLSNATNDNNIFNNDINYSGVISNSSGIDISANSHNNIIQNNLISDTNGNGVNIISSDSGKILENIIFNSYNNALNITQSENIDINNNFLVGTIASNSFIIRFDRTQNSIIFNNLVKNSAAGTSNYGLALSGTSGNGSNNNTIFENDINDNANGIMVEQNSNSNKIYSNIIANNVDYGIRKLGGIDNNIYSNFIINNKYGFRTNQSNNLIYDNYFQNSNSNIFASSGANQWNIEKTIRTNILGGMYTGGNYWSNYLGSNRGDGFGDLNFNTTSGIDYLPLVEFFLINLIGDKNDINSIGVSDLVLMIDGNSTSGNDFFDGIKKVEIFDSNFKLSEFDHNFLQSDFDLSKIKIELQEDYLLVDLNSQLQDDFNKTLYLENNDFISVCVKNEDVSDISDMSSDCLETNEYLFDACLTDGSQSIAGIDCLLDANGIINISNLMHSAVRGNLAPQPSPSSGSSSCTPLFNCSEWSECTNETQTRTCEIINNCLSNFRPKENQECIYLEENDSELDDFDNVDDIANNDSSVIEYPIIIEDLVGEEIVDINKDINQISKITEAVQENNDFFIFGIVMLLILVTFFIYLFVVKKNK